MLAAEKENLRENPEGSREKRNITHRGTENHRKLLVRNYYWAGRKYQYL